MDDVKATILKEKKIQLYHLWRTQSRSSHKLCRDAFPRPGDAQSDSIMILA